MRGILAFMAGAMCGAMVGAVAVLFFTPASGGELRGEARKRFDEMMEEGRKAADERRAELEKQLRTLQRREEA
jgi:gas vesicle protein